MAYHSESISSISKHAQQRMSTRAINEWQIDQVLRYGRASHTRNALIYAIGKREVKEYGKFLEVCAGIHVLCSPTDNTIVTTYRNNDLKGLRR